MSLESWKDEIKADGYNKGSFYMSFVPGFPDSCLLFFLA